MAQFNDVTRLYSHTRHVFRIFRENYEFHRLQLPRCITLTVESAFIRKMHIDDIVCSKTALKYYTWFSRMTIRCFRRRTEHRSASKQHPLLQQKQLTCASRTSRQSAFQHHSKYMGLFILIASYASQAVHTVYCLLQRFNGRHTGMVAP